MPTLNEISDQQEMLAEHRQNLAEHLNRLACLGIDEAPVSLVGNVRRTRSEIRRIKEERRLYGVDMMTR